MRVGGKTSARCHAAIGLKKAHSQAKATWFKCCYFESHFENIFRIDAPADSSEVRQWLRDRAPDKNQMVIVSWNHHHAALVRWNVFCDYWGDFCHPSSDVVTVWPQSEEWALMYLHHEEFVFGIRRGSGAA